MLQVFVQAAAILSSWYKNTVYDQRFGVYKYKSAAVLFIDEKWHSSSKRKRIQNLPIWLGVSVSTEERKMNLLMYYTTPVAYSTNRSTNKQSMKTSLQSEYAHYI